MAEITPENVLKNDKKICWQNVVACCTMPIEGIFFFGTIMGWPNLAEILKNLKVYENVCDRNLTETTIVNGTVNCPERDALFT